MKKLLLGCIHIYRVCSKNLWHAQCRFYPSCSAYAESAVRRYGVWRGTILGIKRIVKCHPLHPGGYDPLPKT